MVGAGRIMRGGKQIDTPHIYTKHPSELPPDRQTDCEYPPFFRRKRSDQMQIRMFRVIEYETFSFFFCMINDFEIFGSLLWDINKCVLFLLPYRQVGYRVLRYSSRVGSQRCVSSNTMHPYFSTCNTRRAKIDRESLSDEILEWMQLSRMFTSALGLAQE